MENQTKRLRRLEWILRHVRRLAWYDINWLIIRLTEVELVKAKAAPND